MNNGASKIAVGNNVAASGDLEGLRLVPNKVDADDKDSAKIGGEDNVAGDNVDRGGEDKNGDKAAGGSDTVDGTNIDMDVKLDGAKASGAGSEDGDNGTGGETVGKMARDGGKIDKDGGSFTLAN